jgi:hypothetical protein
VGLAGQIAQALDLGRIELAVEDTVDKDLRRALGRGRTNGRGRRLVVVVELEDCSAVDKAVND